jgi:hypothetical protein
MLVEEWESSSEMTAQDNLLEYKIAQRMYEKEVAEYNKATNIDMLVEEELERWKERKYRGGQQDSGTDSDSLLSSPPETEDEAETEVEDDTAML